MCSAAIALEREKTTCEDHVARNIVQQRRWTMDVCIK